MQEPSQTKERKSKLESLGRLIRAFIPSMSNVALALLASFLHIISFPDFDLWFVAWLSLIPLLLALQQAQTGKQAFALGWLFGTVFFFSACYWLTHAMINYGGIPTLIAYSLLVPASMLMGLFAASFGVAIHRLISRFGLRALFIAPFVWVALEWLRLQITGQLWNAAGYSQAFVPALIQTARWGSVYAVSFLIVLVNAAFAYAWIERKKKALITSFLTICGCALVIVFTAPLKQRIVHPQTQAIVVALQPNVPMDSMTVERMEELFSLHVTMSETELKKLDNENKQKARLTIWPESPMLFLYTRDSQLREAIAAFTKRNKTSLIINSLEPAPNNGGYNSALLINEEGKLVAQYDKIRLLAFGEYVPVPRWIPGAKYIPAMVGDFTRGTKYTLFPVGNLKAGVFICFEAAFPDHTRKFAQDGADVLIEITNDGYLGPTPVLRQHLANAIFRAVETNRPIVRATNAGITAFINERGEVKDATGGFETARRTWSIYGEQEKTFYVRFGDVFAISSVVMSLAFFALSFRRKEIQ
jgi:apolipoprotein N-acyltransferase